MTLQESRDALCRKLNISWTEITAGTQELFNWDDIDAWIWQAWLEAWDFAPWIFKEKAYTTDTVADDEYYDYPDDFVSDSIFLLRVDDSDGDPDTYKKIRYLDYIQYREEHDTGEEKVWADHGRYYFINPKAWDNTAGRTIEIWGLLRASQFTSSTSVLPFSPNSDNEENSGNHAIVKLAYSYALASDKMNEPQKSSFERDKAYDTLRVLAEREANAQPDYEVYGQPFFKYRKLFPERGYSKDPDYWT